MKLLAIETSCDETSSAVVDCTDGRYRIDGMTILSQDVHRIFGGVVPEIASRAHLATIGSVADDSLRQAGITIADIEAIGVTRGPGLLGALMVGVTWARSVAWQRNIPLVGVHHLEGHLFAPVFEHPDLAPPFTALLVSGGHTMLLDVADWGEYRLLGSTRDDAAGEAFDKVGTLLGLDYPAGPAIEKLAISGNPKQYRFPRPLLRGIAAADRWNFSFSGLKTAVLRAVQQCEDVEANRADLARGFQDALIEVLVSKTVDAADEFGRHRIVIGGGVACNRTLAAAMQAAADNVAVTAASPRLNTDNAAMIGAAACWHLAHRSGWDQEIDARDSWPMPGLTNHHGVVR